MFKQENNFTSSTLAKLVCRASNRQCTIHSCNGNERTGRDSDTVHLSVCMQQCHFYGEKKTFRFLKIRKFIYIVGLLHCGGD